MKTHILIFLLITALMVISCRESSAPKNVGPSIKFQNEEIDLGTMNLFDIMEATIEFENIGGSLLGVDKVIPNCSCISITKGASVIRPSEKGSIKFKYHGIRQGRSNFQIVVFSNDKDQSIIKINGTVFVDSGIITPPKIDLGCLPVTAKYKREIPLTITRPIELKEIRVSTKLIDGEIVYDDDANPKIIIEGTVGDNIGEYREKVYIFGNGNEKPLISIPIEANIFSEDFLVPRKLLFKVNNNSAQPISRTVYIGATELLSNISIINNAKAEYEVNLIHDIQEKRYRAVITLIADTIEEKSEILYCKLDFKDGTTKKYEISCRVILTSSDLSEVKNDEI